MRVFARARRGPFVSAKGPKTILACARLSVCLAPTPTQDGCATRRACPEPCRRAQTVLAEGGRFEVAAQPRPTHKTDNTFNLGEICRNVRPDPEGDAFTAGGTFPDYENDACGLVRSGRQRPCGLAGGQFEQSLYPKGISPIRYLDKQRKLVLRPGHAAIR